MKISEVIERLNEFFEKWGNLEVCCPSRLIDMTNRVHSHNVEFFTKDRVYDCVNNKVVDLKDGVVINSNEIYEDDLVFNEGARISGLIDLLNRCQKSKGDVEVVTTMFSGPTKERDWTLYGSLSEASFNVLKKEGNEVSCLDGSMLGEKVDRFWPSEHPESMTSVLYIGGRF